MERLYRYIVQGLLGGYIDEGYQVEIATISSTKLHLRLHSVELSSVALELLGTSTNMLGFSSTHMGTLEITLQCVYFIPFAIAIAIEGLEIVLLEKNESRQCEEMRISPSPALQTSSKAQGMIYLWISSCFDSLRVDILNIQLTWRRHHHDADVAGGARGGPAAGAAAPASSTPPISSSLPLVVNIESVSHYTDLTATSSHSAASRSTKVSIFTGVTVVLQAMHEAVHTVVFSHSSSLDLCIDYISAEGAVHVSDILMRSSGCIDIILTETSLRAITHIVAALTTNTSPLPTDFSPDTQSAKDTVRHETFTYLKQLLSEHESQLEGDQEAEALATKYAMACDYFKKRYVEYTTRPEALATDQEDVSSVSSHESTGSFVSASEFLSMAPTNLQCRLHHCRIKWLLSSAHPEDFLELNTHHCACITTTVGLTRLQTYTLCIPSITATIHHSDHCVFSIDTSLEVSVTSVFPPTSPSSPVNHPISCHLKGTMIQTSLQGLRALWNYLRLILSEPQTNLRPLAYEITIQLPSITIYFVPAMAKLVKMPSILTRPPLLDAAAGKILQQWKASYCWCLRAEGLVLHIKPPANVLKTLSTAAVLTSQGVKLFIALDQGHETRLLQLCELQGGPEPLEIAITSRTGTVKTQDKLLIELTASDLSMESCPDVSGLMEMCVGHLISEIESLVKAPAPGIEVKKQQRPVELRAKLQRLQWVYKAAGSRIVVTAHSVDSALILQGSEHSGIHSLQKVTLAIRDDNSHVTVGLERNDSSHQSSKHLLVLKYQLKRDKASGTRLSVHLQLQHMALRLPEASLLPLARLLQRTSVVNIPGGQGVLPQYKGLLKLSLIKTAAVYDTGESQLRLHLESSQLQTRGTSEDPCQAVLLFLEDAHLGLTHNLTATRIADLQGFDIEYSEDHARVTVHSLAFTASTGHLSALAGCVASLMKQHEALRCEWRSEQIHMRASSLHQEESKQEAMHAEFSSTALHVDLSSFGLVALEIYDALNTSISLTTADSTPPLVSVDEYGNDLNHSDFYLAASATSSIYTAMEHVLHEREQMTSWNTSHEVIADHCTPFGEILLANKFQGVLRVDVHIKTLRCSLRGETVGPRKHQSARTKASPEAMEVVLHDLTLHGHHLPTIPTHSRAETLLNHTEARCQEVKVVYTRPSNVQKSLVHRWNPAALSQQPMLQLLVEGSSKHPSGHEEYSIDLHLAPLRCFLDTQMMGFLETCIDQCLRLSSTLPRLPKAPAAAASKTMKHITIHAFTVKLDYESESLNMHKLRRGDTTQLLSLFPLEGLLLQMKPVLLHHRTGSVPALMREVLEQWRADVDALGTYRFLEGTAQFKGIAAVLARVAELVQSLAADPNALSAVKHLNERTVALGQTLLCETLDISHRTTHLAAQSILSRVHVQLPWIQAVPTRGGGMEGYLRLAYTCLRTEVQNSLMLLQDMVIEEGAEAEHDLGFVVSRASEILLRPVAGLAEAFSVALLGIRHQVDRVAFEESLTFMSILATMNQNQITYEGEDEAVDDERSRDAEVIAFEEDIHRI